MCLYVCVCVHACVYNIINLNTCEGSGDECVCVCAHLLSAPPFCIWKESVTAGRGCDSVDAISTMWIHTGYAPHLVTWQRFAHSTGYLLQTYIATMSCKRITEASIVPPPPPFLVHMHDLLCIKGMLAETASEGDDITKYFDALGLEDTSYSPDYNCIEHRT